MFFLPNIGAFPYGAKFPISNLVLGIANMTSVNKQTKFAFAELTIHSQPAQVTISTMPLSLDRQEY
jgi:hypothetical protein